MADGDVGIRPPENTAGTRPRIRALIADDEPLVREMLRGALVNEPDVDVVSECGSGTDALEGARRLAPDVLFLDIRMPGLSGLEVAARLRMNPAPLIVFVTAYDAHALEAFELNALDYLLKPFDTARVRETVRRVRERLGERSHVLPAGASDAATSVIGAGAESDDLVQRVTAALHAMQAGAATPADRFLVSLGGRTRVVNATDVEWIEADGNYARLHLAKGDALLRETMKSLEARLAPRQFIRVHRSALVRVSAIRELEPTAAGDYRIHLASGAKVVMSRSYRDEVLLRLAGS